LADGKDLGIRAAAILGAGSWGTALTTLLGRCERVTLWARDSDLAESIRTNGENRRYLPGVPLARNVAVTDSLEEALSGAECVVFAVPSSGMRETAAHAAGLVPSGALLVSAAKGLEDQTGRRMSEVMRESLGDSARITALSGPNLAVEVARGIPTASVAASPDREAALACQTLWMGPAFRVYTSADLVGVELAGAMKNVIAIGAGICEGIGFGDNSRAAFMTRGLAEITRLGTALGAQPSTFLGLAGVGDLIATGGSRLSRNYRVGVGLGQGRSLNAVLEEIGQVAEGVPTTRAICVLARRAGIEMPIAEALHGALFDGADVRESITRLMLRPPKNEIDF
jgi:glycerol-3-phosphate dehydrogenase (NAD(P)+)